MKKAAGKLDWTDLQLPGVSLDSHHQWVSTANYLSQRIIFLLRRNHGQVDLLDAVDLRIFLPPDLKNYAACPTANPLEKFEIVPCRHAVYK
jgi:hypothetical protein